MSDNTKITPEQMKQIQQLQQMMMQQQGGGASQGMPPGFGASKAPSKWTPKGMLIAILQGMQNSVKFIDQFINFIVKKDSDTTNDVIKDARSPIMFGVFVLVFFVFVGIIWSSFAPLDSAAVAIGTVISNTNKKAINHREGGIIKKIYVKVGDRVEQGDKLLELDDTHTKSEYETLLNQYRSYSAYESRLHAEINKDEDITYPDFLLEVQQVSEVAKIIETQNNLFSSKNDLQMAEKNSLKQKIEQSKKQIEGLKAKKIASQKTFEIVQDRLSANRKLQSKGYVKKETILEFEAREANAQSDIAVTDTEISRVEQDITRTEIDLINLSSKNSKEALTELKEVQINLANVKERFIEAQDALKRSIVRSPVDGIVNSLNFHTIGSTIPPSQPIMEVSPSGDTLIIEAKIQPIHIDSISVGLESKIRFSAFKSRTTPSFSGKVISLSPDLVVDHGQPMDPKLAGGYYLARIELNMERFNELATPRKLKLQPGMQAEVQIITGTRTLLQYLLDPVIDAMFKGFKEK